MRTLRRLLILAATAFVLAVLVLDALALVGWPDSGPIALAQVLAAHLTIATLIVIPVAFLHEARLLRAGLVALVVMSLVRFSGEWWSLPAWAPEDAASLDVVTLNLEVGSGSPATSVAFLRTTDARIIALQELTPSVSAAIAADAVLADRYPYQALYPRADVLGLGLLSADPLGDVRFDLQPSRLVATVATPVGPIRVIDVHPLHGDVVRGPFGLPLGYETDDRAGALDTIRATIADDERTSPVLLLGDINTAPTEPAFGRFLSALSGMAPSASSPYRDAHAEVGLGPGWTYRPDAAEPLGIGLIRIDVVFSGPGLRPVAETTRCPATGDHCAVIATVVADP